MANQNVIDELIVQLTLDAEKYSRAEAKIDRDADRTFRNQQERARRTDRTNRDQQRRLKDVASGVKAFALQVTAAVGVVTGLGAAVGGVLSGFLNFETGLRRQAVGTALSNRQMQAWGATARRMGADANAGAEAIANLAREQKIGLQTGNAPTLQGLARIGVNIDPSRSIEDVLAQAQSIYRGAPKAQRQQYETTLLASGVSADLVLMIKSEIDARDAYARSFSQAAEENRKALDQLADSYESIKASGIAVAATLLEALQPAIASGAEQLQTFATKVADFSRSVQDAGGGVDAFQSSLDKHLPWLGHLFEGFRLLGGVVQGVWQGLKNLMDWLPTQGQGVRNFLNRSRNPFGTEPLGDAIQNAAGRAVRGLFGNDSGDIGAVGRANLAVNDWLRKATAKPGDATGLPRNIENDPPARLPRNIENDAPIGSDAQSLMTTLTSQYGLSVPQAAALVANWQRESGLRPNAINREGGGTGARGLAQWRGARTEAFRKRYGVMPDQASVAQQVEFALTDPYERSLLNKSFAVGGDADQLGVAVSKIYEAHGNVREDLRRGREAGALAAGYGGQPGATVNIQNLNVQSNDAQSFVGDLQRLDTTQPYNSVIR